MAGLVLILRPYKKTIYNIIDFLTLFLMTLLAALSVTYIDFIFSIFIVCLFYLPFLCLIVYLIYHMLKCCACQSAFRKSTHNKPSEASEQQPLLIPPTTRTVVGLGDYAEDDEYPDRMVHPDGYT